MRYEKRRGNFLHRKLIDSQVFKNAELLKVWIWCLLKANHKAAWISVITGRGSTQVYLKPGQFIFGRKSAARELGMASSSVRNRIHFLKSTGNLDIQTDTHYSIITIINLDRYQKSFLNDGHPFRTGKGQPKDTNNNDNNEYIYNGRKKSSQSHIYDPPDYLTDKDLYREG